MEFRFSNLALLLIVYAMLLPYSAIGQESDTGLLDEIRSAWRERAITYETARFQWISESVRVSDEAIELPPGAVPAPNPQTYISYYTLAGESGFELANWQGTVPGSDEPVPREHVNIFHEGKGRFYNAQGPIGNILNENPLLRRSRTAEIILGAFFEEPPFLYNDRYQILRVEGENGDRVVVLGNTDYNDPQRNGASRTEYELREGELGWAVRSRRMMLPNGRVIVDEQIEYTDDQSRAGIPDTVTYARFLMTDPSVLEVHGESTIAGLEINVPVDTSVFELEFPPGTRVYDEFTHEQYVVSDNGQSSLDKYLDEVLVGIQAVDTSSDSAPASAQESEAAATELPRLPFGLAAIGALIAVPVFMRRHRE